MADEQPVAEPEAPRPAPQGEQLRDAGSHGKVFQRGSDAFLRDQSGRLVTVPESEAMLALESGYTPASPGEVYETDRRAEIRRFGEQSGLAGSALALGEAAVRGAADTALAIPRMAEALAGREESALPTGGELLGGVEEALGLSTEENMRKRAEAHNVASTIGGVAADLIPTMAAMKVGGAVAKGSSLLKRVGVAAATEGAAGGVSGGAYAGEEAWRRGSPVNSDHLMASIGTAALLGGGLGAAGLAASEGVGFLRGKLASMNPANAASRLTTGVHALSGAEDILRGLGSAKLTATSQGRSVLEKTTSFHGLSRAARVIGDSINFSEGTRVIKAAKAEADAIRRGLGREAAKAEAKFAAATKRLDTFTESAAKRAAKRTAQAEGTIKAAARQDARMARRADDAVKRTARTLTTSDEQLAAAKRNSASRVAKAQTDFDAAATQLKAIEKEISALKAQGAVKMSPVVDGKLEAARAKYTAASTKLDTVRADTKAKLDSARRKRTAASRDHADARKAREELSRSSLAKEARERAQARERSELLEDEAVRTRYTNDRNTAETLWNKAKSDTEATRLAADAVEAKAIADASEAFHKSPVYRTVQGGLGMAQGYARMGLRQNIDAFARSSMGGFAPELEIDRAQAEFSSSIDSALLRASGASDGRNWSMVSGVGNYEEFPVGQFRYPGETKREAFFNRLDELERLAMNPELMVEQLSSNVESLAFIDPEMANNMVNSSMRAIGFLSQYKGHRDQVNPLTGKSEGYVSADDIDSFEKVWNGVMFPGVLVDELATWNLSDETVMAVGQVHPSLLQDVQQRVIGELAGGMLKPTYQQRLQLSVLTGLRDDTLTPEFMATYSMATESAMAQSQNTQGRRKPGRPTGSPTLGQQYRTMSQRLSEEK